MIPGELIYKEGSIELNRGRKVQSITVANSGDRPIQIGSHYHFFEVNKLLKFDRALAYGMHLDIPSGTSVRFEPGEEKSVQLVEIGGNKRVFGLNNLTKGQTTSATLKKALNEATLRGFYEE